MKNIIVLDDNALKNVTGGGIWAVIGGIIVAVDIGYEFYQGYKEGRRSAKH